ncbi:MAG: hypothetical protein LIP12_02940 [Clostridiales bacterium]|nr:hypothetical protein [Clostridiales bacterium]
MLMYKILTGTQNAYTIERISNQAYNLNERIFNQAYNLNERVPNRAYIPNE